MKRSPSRASSSFAPLLVCFFGCLAVLAYVRRQTFLTEPEDAAVRSTGESADRYFARLLAAQKDLCGSLCTVDAAKLAPDFDLTSSTTTLHSIGELSSNFVSKNVRCDKLFDPDTERILEPTSIFPGKSLKLLPKSLVDEFSFGGRIAVKGQIASQSAFDSELLSSAESHGLPLNWSWALIEEQKRQVIEGTLDGSFSALTTRVLYSRLRSVGLQGKTVLVFGSDKPWVEATCLAAGAKEIISVRYSTVFSDHPQIKVMTPAGLSAAYRRGELTVSNGEGVFDVTVAVSYLEYRGLGRFGDGLNPWGDVIAGGKMSCLTKLGGIGVFGVPDKRNGKDTADCLLFPLNRVYGRQRMPYLLTNWKTISVEEAYHSRVLITAKNERTP